MPQHNHSPLALTLVCMASSISFAHAQDSPQSASVQEQLSSSGQTEAQTEVPAEDNEHESLEYPEKRAIEDPFESINRPVHRFNDKVDSWILRPLAKGYQAVTPQAAQVGVSNFFANLGELPSSLNHLAQARPHNSVVNLTRFAINSTAGLLGAVDVASKLGLYPARTDTGLTLARWGVAQGPYVVLPLLGPASLRDGPSRLVDAALDPVQRADSYSAQTSVQVLSVTSARANLLEQTDLLNRISLDGYSATRDAWASFRQSRVQALEDDSQ